MNTIYTDNGFITVQSCDEEYANIGVFVSKPPGRTGSKSWRSAYYHVSLPSLAREWKPGDFNHEALTGHEFDAVLAAYRNDLLETIAQLNGTACNCAKYVPTWLIPGSACWNCGLPPFQPIPDSPVR